MFFRDAPDRLFNDNYPTSSLGGILSSLCRNSTDLVTPKNNPFRSRDKPSSALRCRPPYTVPLQNDAPHGVRALERNPNRLKVDAKAAMSTLRLLPGYRRDARAQLIESWIWGQERGL